MSNGQDPSDDREEEWAGLVRFQLPADWSRRVDEQDGHAVCVFQPPDGDGTLHVVADRVPVSEGAGTGIVLLRELALRFVRPDDSRAGDRIVDAHPQGGILAQLVMRTTEAGGEVHYLWFVGDVRGDRIATAMFNFRIAGDRDGLPALAARIDRVERAIGRAILVPAEGGGAGDSRLVPPP